MHPAGFLLVDARPTRTGIFKYRRPDGTVRAEYRPPEEVARADSLTTLRGASVTDLHPVAGRVSPDNVRDLEVGTVTEARMDGSFVVAELIVKRADAIEAVRKKQRVELSCGYQCEFDATPGVLATGERYDGVQRQIRYNHVALLPAGTARGGPECALRLDQNDAVLAEGMLLDDVPNDDERPTEERADQGERPMRKITIKGISFEAPDQTAQAIESVLDETKQRLDALGTELKTTKDRADSLTSELDRTKAKVDALTSDLQKEKELRADATDPQKVQAAVAARVALERSALKVLGQDFKCDGLSDREIQEKVIAHVHRDARLEGKSADYVAARFDSVLESHQASDGLDNTRRRIDPPKQGEGDGPGARTDQGDPARTGARTDGDFRKRLASAYREDLSVTR